VKTFYVLCVCFFYQLLFVLPYFNVLNVIFNSLAAAELHAYSARNKQINEYGSFVERKNSEENLSAIFGHFHKIAKSDYYLHRVRPYETTCLGWTDFHEIWYMSFCRKCVRKIQV
jgi:MarR-like DNA-binding transcriptional regulator SgrR of sgrS sRNA